EPQFRHDSRVEEITPIEEDRRMHAFSDLDKIDIVKFVPFRCQNECFRILDCFDRRLCQDRARAEIQFGDFLNAFWIEDLDDGTLLQQAVDQVDCDRVTNIVGIRLEGEPPHCNPFVFQNPERVPDPFQKSLKLRLVNALDFLQKGKRKSQLFTNRDESRQILWETGSTVTETSVQE